MGVRQFLGDVVDYGSTWLGIPVDVGFSESIAGSNTANTGSKPYLWDQIGNALNTVNKATQTIPQSLSQNKAPNPNKTLADQANQALEKQRKAWERMYLEGMVTFDEKQAAINQARLGIANQFNALKNSYANQQKGLGAQRDYTLQSQNAYFQNISPDAYQGQQAIYANKVGEEYNTGMKELGDIYNTNMATQATANSQVNQQQADLDAYRQALETYRTQGGAEPVAKEMPAINPKYANTDLAKNYENFASLALGNQLKGMTPEANKAMIRNSMKSAGMDENLANFLYAQIFPEDYSSSYYPSASEYQNQIIQGY